MFDFLRDWLQQKLEGKPIPEELKKPLHERFSELDTYDPEELENFYRHLRVFFWDKDWFGVNDFEVTDEMKIIIGASAARLARKLPVGVYDKVREIGVYPGSFRHPEEAGPHAAGMAHDFGTVILSWEAVKSGIEIPDDGYDTAIHEFAHMLDLGSGEFSGTPILHGSQDYRTWSRVISHHFEKLRNNRGRHELLRDYAGINEGEFFAVATEMFFERPETFKRKAPDLYEQLEKYYRVHDRE
jgi:Mlc titration factor MtfA (ptsG expression regulator)